MSSPRRLRKSKRLKNHFNIPHQPSKIIIPPRLRLNRQLRTPRLRNKRQKRPLAAIRHIDTVGVGRPHPHSLVLVTNKPMRRGKPVHRDNDPHSIPNFRFSRKSRDRMANLRADCPARKQPGSRLRTQPRKHIHHEKYHGTNNPRAHHNGNKRTPPTYNHLTSSLISRLRPIGARQS